METFTSILKYTVWVGVYGALAWFGFHEELAWCENIFLFLIWIRLIVGTAGIFVIGHLSNELDNQRFSYDKSVVFYEKNGNKFIMPLVVGVMVEGAIALLFASMAFWWLAAASMYILGVHCALMSVFKSCLTKAKRIVDSRATRASNQTATETEPVDTFEDNNDLFRMGIVRTPED